MLPIFLKPTFQGAPLHHSSMHPWSVHSSWPCGRLHHFRNLCSDRGLFDAASVRFLNRFSEFHPDSRIFERLKSLHHDLYRTEPTPFSLSRPVKESGECSWVVIPFHPSLVAADFMQAIRDVQTDFEAHGFSEFRPRLSWSRYCKHLREMCAGYIVQA